ncbi:hypothetical protein BC628DRAFT_199657 [Trametes gibbosa]|nr:hypothetical protein BC628DRAFT_199657 [Trametes gibbosa]
MLFQSVAHELNLGLSTGLKDEITLEFRLSMDPPYKDSVARPANIASRMFTLVPGASRESVSTTITCTKSTHELYFATLAPPSPPDSKQGTTVIVKPIIRRLCLKLGQKTTLNNTFGEPVAAESEDFVEAMNGTGQTVEIEFGYCYQDGEKTSYYPMARRAVESGESFKADTSPTIYAYVHCIRSASRKEVVHWQHSEPIWSRKLRDLKDGTVTRIKIKENSEKTVGYASEEVDLNVPCSNPSTHPLRGDNFQPGSPQTDEQMTKKGQMSGARDSRLPRSLDSHRIAVIVHGAF